MNTFAQTIENAEFSRRVKLLMSKNGKTLAQIAEHTGNAISTVSTWRRGRIPKSARAKEMLAEALGATPSELFCFDIGEVFSNEKRSNPPESAEDYSSSSQVAAARARRRIKLYIKDFLESVETEEELERIFTDLKVFFPISSGHRMSR